MKHFVKLKALLVAGLLVLLVGGCSSGPTASESGDRLAKAQAMFAERCKTAGERVYRTVEDVEGVFLLKLRPNYVNYGNQFELDDPYGKDLVGDGYIESFLRGSFWANTKGPTAPGAPPRTGYQYIEAIDTKDGRRYRYTGGVREYEAESSIIGGGTGKKFKTTGFVMDRAPASGSAPRYGVTYDDISTREERDYWIAGSSLKVIDLKTNEAIAERVGYMIDLAQGSTAGGRAPWLFAADHACPGFGRNPLRPLRPNEGAAAQRRQAQDFVEKILKPKP